MEVQDDPSPGVEPAGSRRAGLPHRAADAPVRDLDDAAHPRQGAEHQAQLRLALRGRRVAAEARADHGAGDDPGGTAPRAHRLRDHRGRGRGVRGLAGRAALDAGAGVHLARGRPVADAGPAAGRGRPGCSTSGPTGCGCELRAAGRRARRSAAELRPARPVRSSRAATGRPCSPPSSSSSTELAAEHPLRQLRRHQDLAPDARAAGRGHVVRGDLRRPRRPSRGGGARARTAAAS